jgi:hypothetical protein
MKKNSAGYKPSKATKRDMEILSKATIILNRAFAFDQKDNSQQANIGRSHLNCFALNLEHRVCLGLRPQYDDAIVEMTRWLEGDKAAQEERLAQ